MISREAFDAYDRALAQNADMAVDELDAIFAEYLSTITQDDLRSTLAELMPALAEKYGSRAAAAAKEFYLEERSAMEDAGEFEPIAAGADGDSIRRASLAAIERSASLKSLNASLDGILVRHVNAAADETVVWNARSDPARPKWALVPSAGACGFCLLIASRGFDYASKEKVARHDHCKCTTVVDFSDDPALEGYDLGEVQGLYKDAKESMDDGELYREWEEAKSSDPRVGSFDNFKRNRIAAKMGSAAAESRLRAETARNVDAAKGLSGYTAENLDVSALGKGELKRLVNGRPLEWAGYVRLSELGYRQALLHESRGASANIDTRLTIGGAERYYDLKTILGGTGAVRRRLTECRSKWARLSAPGATVPEGIDIDGLGLPRAIVDNRFSKIDDSAAARKIRETISRLRGGEFPIEEVILIKRDGTAETITP